MPFDQFDFPQVHLNWQHTVFSEMAQIGQISLLFIMNNVLPPRPSMGTIPKYIFNELKLVESSDIASDALTAAAVCFQLSTVIALSYSSKAIQIPVYVNSIQF